MTTVGLITLCGAFLLASIGIITFYIVRVLRSANLILEITEEILEDAKPQIERILRDASDSTSSVREVTVKLLKVLTNLISLPDFAKAFARQAISTLLFKEKRGS